MPAEEELDWADPDDWDGDATDTVKELLAAIEAPVAVKAKFGKKNVQFLLGREGKET